MNSHVAEPLRSIVNSLIDPLQVGWSEAQKTPYGGNLSELQARSDRMTMDLARKQMAVDVLRAMLAAKPNGVQAQVDAVIALVNAEAAK